MLKLTILFLAVAFLSAARAVGGDGAGREAKTVLVIHGGSGVLPRKEMTPEKRAAFEEDLKRALRAGHEVLRRGGRGVDAVEAAVKVMEDSPLFNAGKGAALTREGNAELEAAIMDGKGRKAGAVAVTTTIKNPIAAARAVMDRSEHVLIAGPGADRFARECGLETVDPSYFVTDHQREALRKKLDKKKGTVGAVALDAHGDLAAATSTGGLTGKAPGRVGDSASIGAGTFADNAACAVSCTGEGEIFLRAVAAHGVAARLSFKGTTLAEAADEVIGQVKRLGGEGGLIAVDAEGRVAMPYASEGMYRGFIKSDGEPHVFIYEE